MLSLTGFDRFDIVKNNVFKNFKERITDPNIVSLEATDKPYFINEPGFTNKLSKESFNELSNHSLIKVNKFETFHDIASISFTKKAFYDQAWDDNTSYFPLYRAPLIKKQIHRMHK